MTFDLVPGSFWNFPSIKRWPFIEDEDWDYTTSSPSGLSISEDDKNVYIEASVPGVNPNNVEVTFHKGVLWIKAENKEEESDKNKKFYRKATRSFSYRITVPGEIDQKADPKAVTKNGIMTVTFTKVPTEQPKKISVKSE